MFKELIKLSLLTLTLFCVNIKNICAYEYEYIDSSHESSILNTITEIHDAKEQYEDLAGTYEEQPEMNTVSSNMYWLPIGSNETREVNGKIYADGIPPTSYLVSHFSDMDSRDRPHGGIDFVVDGSGIGNINIIASKSGTVVYPTDKSQINFEDKGTTIVNGIIQQNPDGSGWGNYVTIQHADGTYTRYAHLAKGSITVMAGDVVDQGQVIGKLGNSGTSTGPHLHFEILDVNMQRIDPEPFIDFNNPRPTSLNSGSFSLTTTSLSKIEFKAKMQDYYNRTNDKNFYNNFLLNSDDIYDVSIENKVNPELVVVTAKSESSFVPCGNTNNYWGLGISNGEGCNAGPSYANMKDAVAGYAHFISKYNEYGQYASTITNRYNERKNAGCSDAGYGLPGTLAGMQSVYSWIGDYRYNPGSPGLGGCYALKSIYNDTSYCDKKPSCTDYNNCSDDTKTTVCEQSDYTAYQIKQKIQYRYDIFGL